MQISIALCTYNGSKYLSDQLLSIAQQTRLPDELVICDDRSNDNTLQIVEAFAKDAQFKVQFHQNEYNLGTTRNFEQAIRLCEGNIIALCDQDDYWYPDKLEVIEKVFRTHSDVGLAFSNADVVDAHRNRLGYTLWEAVRFNSKRQRLLANGEASSILLRRAVVTGAAMAFRTQYRDLVLPISPTCVHDEWITFLIAIVAKLHVIQKPLLQYRQHGTNQIGAEKVGYFKGLKNILTNEYTPKNYFERYEKYQALYTRVSERLPDNSTILTKLAEKAAHLYIRGTLPDQYLKRIAPILKELLNGHYQHYSGNWFSPLRDLILKH